MNGKPLAVDPAQAQIQINKAVQMTRANDEYPLRLHDIDEFTNAMRYHYREASRASGDIRLKVLSRGVIHCAIARDGEIKRAIRRQY